MKTSHRLTLPLMVLVILGAAQMALSASKDFEAAVDRLLAEYSGSMVGDLHDKALLDAVFSNGTASDFQATLWRCMNDPAQRNKWYTAIQLSSTANISDKDVAMWARRNLELLVKDAAKPGLDWLAILFSGRNGEAKDVDRLRAIAAHLPADKAAQAQLINQTADGIRDGQAFFQEMGRQEGAAGTANPSQIGTKSAAIPTTKSPKDIVTSGSTNSQGALNDETPWSIIIVMTVAASGLLWLLLKQRDK